MKRWALAGTVLLAGCAGGTTTFGEETPRSRGYRIRLEAACGTCLIRWSAGERGAQSREKSLWSESFYVFVHPDSPMAVRLTASTVPGSRPVAYVRIRVAGEVVAEARGRDDWTGSAVDPGGTLSVEAVIPERER